MRSTTYNSNLPEKGFTLVEMLIIAPIALLIISGFVALMVTLTGDTLASSARTSLIRKTDEALSRFEQDARFANEFRTESFTPVAPQGRNNDTEKFEVWQTYPDPDNTPYGTARILRSYATDKNPLDATKKLIYSTSPTPSACNTIAEIQNEPLLYDTIYYVKLDSGTSESDYKMSLWRRIIFNPSQTACPGSVPWQKSTCTPGITGTPCQAEDEKLIDNIPNAGLKGYYPNTPDRSYSDDPTLEPYDIDCIRACPDGYNVMPSDPDSYNILNPYATDGTNAKSSYFGIITKVTVAGRDIEYKSGIYVRRSN